MAVGLQFATLFTSLPREIRDMVYAHLFNNKDHMVGFGKRYYVVSNGNRSLDNFLIVIHEKSFDSWAAREMCEAFWSVKLAQHTFDISWEDLSDLLNPGLVTTLETSGKEVQRRRHGIYPRVSIPLITPISPKDFVTELEIDINDDDEPKLTNESDLCKLTQGLPAVLRFPRLRRTAINLWIPGDCDCFWEVMPLVESISATCQELQRMIGTNLSVWILRDWPHHRSTFKCMDHDISWMWEVPGQEVRMIRGVRAPTAAEDRVRTMMSIDFRSMNLKKSLLQELRDAASSFAQRREESAREEGGLTEKI